MAKGSNRKRKQTPLFSPGRENLYGLEQPNPGAIKDSRLAQASTWWKEELRATWRLSASSVEDFAFVPSSLKKISNRDVRKYGTEGVHYAEGWEQLYEMIVKHGLDYAPSLVIPPTTVAMSTDTTESDMHSPDAVRGRLVRRDSCCSSEEGSNSVQNGNDESPVGVNNQRSNLISPQFDRPNPMRQYENRVVAIENVAFGSSCVGGLKARVEALELFFLGLVREDGGIEGRLMRLENPAIMREAEERLATIENVVFGDISSAGFKMRLEALDLFRFGRVGDVGSFEERLTRLET